MKNDMMTRKVLFPANAKKGKSAEKTEERERQREKAVYYTNLYYDGATSEEKQEGLNGLYGLVRGFIWKILHTYYASYSAYFEDMEHEAVLEMIGELNSTRYDPRKSMPATYFERNFVHAFYYYTVRFVNETSDYYDFAEKKIDRTFSEDELMAAPVSVIAKRTGLSDTLVKEIINKKKRSKIYVSELEEMEEEGMYTRQEPVIGKVVNIEEYVINKEMSSYYNKELIRLLTPIQRQVIWLRYDFARDGKREASFKTISSKLHISQVEAKMIHDEALEILRNEIPA